MKKKILVVQFRLSEDAACDERDDLLRSIGEAAIEFKFINILGYSTNLLDWSKPEKVLLKYDGVILGGSGDIHFNGGVVKKDKARMIMQDIIAKITPFAKYLIDNDIPTLGICLGHQILAHACGAVIEPCERQSKLGTFDITHTCECSHPIFGNMPKTFKAQYAHKDTVKELPDTVKILATGDNCDSSALQFSDNVYSTQFHPEIDYDTITARLKHYPEYLPEGKEASDFFIYSPEAVQILRNFIDFVDSQIVTVIE